MAAYHIGTSGWQYRHWRGDFYPIEVPIKNWLAHYVTQFDTVELNSTFYGLPTYERFEKWKQSTPPKFFFAVKANRFITHNKKLSDAGESLDKFLSAAKGLGRKLGPILFQLPPSLHLDLERLETFLKLLPKRLQCVFEFRHESWFVEETYDLLRKHNAAFCIYELGKVETPIVVTANFSYIRLHGPGQKYRGSYSDEQLQRWADEILQWDVKDVYVYFDNDIGGHAPHNALTLKRMLSE
jgi:uncharacterized protein YecE (DUF72 family)